MNYEDVSDRIAAMKELRERYLRERQTSRFTVAELETWIKEYFYRQVAVGNWNRLLQRCKRVLP